MTRENATQNPAVTGRRFADRSVVVTGAAQGIGKATAERFAAEGGRVVVADRVAAEAGRVAAAIEEAGGVAVAIIADLETRGGAAHLIEKSLAEFDGIDILVNNVGGTIWAKPFWEYRPDEIEMEIRRSLWPTLWCCHAAIPAMMARKRGAIVNVGSVATRGIYRVPYAAAKGGIEAITQVLALELADHGIRVNSVAPGGVDVGKRVIPRNPNPPSDREVQWWDELYRQTLRDTPLGRFGRPDEIAAAICFLASDDASYVTGQTIFAAGGGIG